MNDESKNNKNNKRIQSIKKDDIVGLFVGRITREKGIQTILDSLHIMSKSENQYNFKMLFVGEGPDIEYYKELAWKNNLSDVITFVGEKVTLIIIINVLTLFFFHHFMKICQWLFWKQ